MKPEPRYDGDVPFCASDKCSRYDGKRCELLGARPSLLCEPAVASMGELARLVGVWRSARCVPPGASQNDVECDGDNHVERCPVELARQDVVAAHNALGMRAK